MNKTVKKLRELGVVVRCGDDTMRCLVIDNYYYTITNTGAIWLDVCMDIDGCEWVEYGKIHIIKTDTNGYNRVSIHGIGVVRLNILIAYVFGLFDGCDLGGRLVVNHKNNISTDNHVTNLEVTTIKLNVIHGKVLRAFVRYGFGNVPLEASKCLDVTGTINKQYCNYLYEELVING